MAQAKQEARLVFPLSGEEAALVSSVSVIQREYMHDVARIRVQHADARPVNHRAGTPLQITWSRSPVGMFYGYVHHIEPEASRETKTMTVVAIGASYPLKQKRQRVFRNLSRTDVAEQIADSHHLDVDVEPHLEVVPSISQVGESDWELLVRLAKEIGYVVYVDRTQLRFHSRTRDLLALRSQAPTFVMASTSSGGGTLLSFRAEVGETLPTAAGKHAARKTYGVDPFGAGLVGAAHDGQVVGTMGIEVQETFFDAYETGTVTHSPVSGISTLAGTVEQNRFHIQATATVVGNARLRQAMPVYLGGMASAENDGYWLAHGVTHTLDSTGYQMSLTLGRDSLRNDLVAPSGPAKRDLSFLPITPAVSGGLAQAQPPLVKLPVTVLRNPHGAGSPRKPIGTTTSAPAGNYVPRTRQLVRRDRVSSQLGSAVVSAQPGAFQPVERGSRTVNPPLPVRSTTAHRLNSPTTISGRPTALWQADYRSRPIRQQAPQEQGGVIMRRLQMLADRE